MTRQSCLVPFCRRTTDAAKLAAKGHDEWICTDHWKLVDRRVKWLKRTAERRLTRGQGDAIMLSMTAWRAWKKAKAQAIERSAGLG